MDRDAGASPMTRPPISCPHCKAPLSEAEIRTIRGQYHGRKQTPHPGGYTKAMRATKASAKARKENHGA